jgi:hypothetical protein
MHCAAATMGDASGGALAEHVATTPSTESMICVTGYSIYVLYRISSRSAGCTRNRMS